MNENESKNETKKESSDYKYFIIFLIVVAISGPAATAFNTWVKAGCHL